jgi:Acetyltransferase (GNAT) domain
MAELLGASSKIWIAWYKGEPIAAKIGLSYKSRAFAFRGYSNKDVANPVSANDLLHRYMIESACREGCTSYNLGGSGGVPGLEAYKAKLGGISTAFPVYTIESYPTRLLTRSSDGLTSATRAIAGRWQQRGAASGERVEA